MAFDGFGQFIRLRNWVTDATAGVKIRADFHDTEDDGFAAGLSQCIVRDGQTTITQNIPFNSKRITALQDPIDPQDAATKAYVNTQDAAQSAKKLGTNLQVFTSVGVADFTVPADVTRVYAKCIGGGGGGGAKAYTAACGGGGGGGGITEGYVNVTPAQVITVTVGAGGIGGHPGAGAGPGTPGGTSSFGAFMSAPGGTGGHGYPDSTSQGGVSGFGVGGQINGGYGDGSTGYPISFSGSPENASPGCGGGPGGQNGTGGSPVQGGFPGRAPGGGGGGTALADLGSTAGDGYRGEVYIWW